MRECKLCGGETSNGNDFHDACVARTKYTGDCKTCGTDLESSKKKSNAKMILEAMEWVKNARLHLENVKDMEGNTAPEVADSLKKCRELMKYMDSAREKFSR